MGHSQNAMEIFTGKPNITYNHSNFENQEEFINSLYEWVD